MTICTTSDHWNKLLNFFISIFVHWKEEGKKNKEERKGRDEKQERKKKEV